MQLDRIEIIENAAWGGGGVVESNGGQEDGGGEASIWNVWM